MPVYPLFSLLLCFPKYPCRIAASSSTCGYCSPSGQRSLRKSSKTYGVWAHQLSCAQYKLLIDRGWRRSGKYLYKPNMRDTCCPQYTIRLRATEFRPSKSQRAIVNRFNAFIRHGGRESQPGWGTADTAETHAPAQAEAESSKDAKGKGKAKPKQQKFHLAQALHSTEDRNDTKHKFDIGLVPAKFTKERYLLYKRYQMEIHKEKESKLSEDGFKRFLCESPMRVGLASVRKVQSGLIECMLSKERTIA